MNKLKVAIVGCGSVAQKRHIPGFLRLKKTVELTALCDLNPRLVEAASKNVGIRNAYSNLSEMLLKEELDIVDICTPPSAHLSIALKAIEHGCNVLLEKPMALNVSDCDKMIDSSEKYGVKLSVVHNQRFYQPFMKAQELVSSGAVGKITGMRILSLTNKNEYMVHENHWVHNLPGGVISETGPHIVYMSLAFMNAVKAVEVSARKTLKYPWVLYDDYRIELEGDSLNTSIYVSHAGDYTSCLIDLFGEEGAITINLESMLLTRSKLNELNPTSVALSSLSTAGQIVKGVASNFSRVAFHKPMLGHDIMIERFVNSIINDQPVPVTPEEGRETARIMGMIVANSSETGYPFCPEKYVSSTKD
ncbi:MAG: Gfo/Idh/MocA family oxidoreductase [Candidatus Bathyarchaeia archaeon]|jgi:predicted dehydrogenase